MKQFIARVDDDLHERLAEMAKAEGRSINSVVVDALEAAVTGEDSARLKRAVRGQLVVPKRPARIPSWSEIEHAGRGAGNAVSEALDRDRHTR